MIVNEWLSGRRKGIGVKRECVEKVMTEGKQKERRIKRSRESDRKKESMSERLTKKERDSGKKGEEI